MRVSSPWAVFVAIAAVGCTVGQVEPPELTGPSTFGTSVSVTATPEVLTLGPSATTPGQQSVVAVSVFDEHGQPKANQYLTLDVVVNGETSGCGQLSQRTLTTGSDGRATAIYTAPGTPPNCPGFNSDGTVTIRATPFGSQATPAAAGGVNIYMALRTTGGGNPSGTFAADFTVSALGGLRNFQFNGTSSTSPGHSIVSYAWTFSDGHAEKGPIVDHDFGAPGTYFVTLTVTDDIGQSAFKTALVIAN
jgi:PKD domain-containing protein